MRHLTLSRASLVVLPVALLTAAALVFAGFAPAAPKTLTGTVGPGFTISLKLGGKKVTRLKAGRNYRFSVTDKADIHNFHIKGPGVNRAITGVNFTGTKTVTIKLRKGTYRYQCDVHPSLNGRFKAS
jgi:hypothetical protein